MWFPWFWFVNFQKRQFVVFFWTLFPGHPRFVCWKKKEVLLSLPHVVRDIGYKLWAYCMQCMLTLGDLVIPSLFSFTGKPTRCPSRREKSTTQKSWRWMVKREICKLQMGNPYCRSPAINFEQSTFTVNYYRFLNKESYIICIYTCPRLHETTKIKTSNTNSIPEILIYSLNWLTYHINVDCHFSHFRASRCSATCGSWILLHPNGLMGQSSSQERIALEQWH